MQLQTNPADPCLLPFQARLFSEEVVCFRFLIAAIPHYLLLPCVLHVCILSLTFQSRKIFRRISYYPYKEKKIREIKHRIYGKRQTAKREIQVEKFSKLRNELMITQLKTILKDRIGVNLPIFVSGNLVIRYKFTFAVGRKRDAKLNTVKFRK